MRVLYLTRLITDPDLIWRGGSYQEKGTPRYWVLWMTCFTGKQQHLWDQVANAFEVLAARVAPSVNHGELHSRFPTKSAAQSARTRNTEGGPPSEGIVQDEERWQERVLALIIGRGRDWTGQKLADAVGVARQTLYTDERVKVALRARRAPGGSVAEGDMDGERRRLE